MTKRWKRWGLKSIFKELIEEEIIMQVEQLIQCTVGDANF